MGPKRHLLTPVQPFADFTQAASAVLQTLHATMGLGLWMVTRTEGENWIVLNAENHSYEVRAGDVFRWSDSFCYRMVQGLGPRIAPRAEQVPAYVDAPIGKQVPIGAYIGVPLTLPDGSLFGTLCAIDPQPRAETLRNRLPELETYSRLLATILSSELENQAHSRRLERVRDAAETDPLTGLYNRRGWERLRNGEEERCQRYGDPAGVVMIDLDGLKRVNDTRGHEAGDQLLTRTAETLQGAVGRNDVVARLGGDEFAVLGVNLNAEGIDRLERRIVRALVRAHIKASVGSAVRDPRRDLESAQARADERMYRRKKRTSAPSPRLRLAPLSR